MNMSEKSWKAIGFEWMGTGGGCEAYYREDKKRNIAWYVTGNADGDALPAEFESSSHPIDDDTFPVMLNVEDLENGYAFDWMKIPYSPKHLMSFIADFEHIYDNARSSLTYY